MAVPSTILDLSTSAASNSPAGSETVGPNLDNYLRAIEAIVRQESENKAWERWGHTPTYISATSFSVTGDQTAVYTALRRIKCTVSGSPLYGSVVSAVFGAVTTVTVKLDSGSLTAGLTEVALGLESNALRYLYLDSAFNQAKGTDLASAATVNIGAATGDYITITGTTTITAFDTIQAGARRLVRFSGALTLTHNATSLILPGAANYTTAAGDLFEFVSEGSGNWRVDTYALASGRALVASVTTSVQAAFKNLKIVASGTTNTSAVLTADEVVLEDGSNNYFTAHSVSETINSTASGANGLDTGSLAASTWYAVWLIAKADGTVDGLLSLSATAPTLPSGYIYKARLGWVRTDGTGNKYLLQTLQNGRSAQYALLAGSNITAYPTIASGVQGTFTSGACTLVSTATTNYVPSTSAKIHLTASGSATSAAVVAAAPNSGPYTGWSGTNQTPIALSSPASQTAITGQFVMESSNIYYAGANAASLLQVVGWEDNI